jgi:hypothetical protein
MAAVAVGSMIIIVGMRTVAALASVVVAGTRGSTDSHSTESTGTNGLTETAGAMADFTVFLTATAQQFRRASSYQSALCQVAAVVGMGTVIVVAGFLTDVNHAVIAAVVVTAVAASSLRNRITGAQLSSRALIIVLADSAVAVVVVGVLVSL